jgi:hypothetical protein
VSRVGRNDPCPCGSGKKFKRCCGASSSAGVENAEPLAPEESGADGERRRAQAAWSKASRALAEHMLDWVGTRRAESALENFELPESVRPHERDAWLPVLISWNLYDWVPKGKTQAVAAHFLADGRRGPRDADVVSLIRATNDEALSFFQVEAVDPGSGARLRDLFTGEERFVSDKSFSEVARPWAVVFARLAPFGEVTIFDALGPRPLGPEWAAEFVADFEEDFGWKLPVAKATLRAHATLLIAQYFDTVEEDDAKRGELPVLHTSDGERIVFCKDTWTVLEGREEVPAILEKLGLEPDENAEGVFVWARDDENDGQTSTVLGRVVLEGEALRLETNSRERRKRMKARLARALGKRVLHTNFEERTVEDEMKRPRLVPNEPPPAPSPAEAEAVRAWITAHYATWPDTPLPAFGGKTPRSMTKTKRGRAEVEALIREMEYRSHGSPMEGTYDFDVLRRELGFGSSGVEGAGRKR